MELRYILGGKKKKSAFTYRSLWFVIQREYMSLAENILGFA